jgi:hypothetical protein
MVLDKQRIEEEIAALQKQAAETQTTLIKLEGALQFAYHTLNLLAAEAPAEVVEDKIRTKQKASKDN